MKKISLLLFLVSITLFVGCEKDLYENQIQERKSRKISFQQFKNETNVSNKLIFKKFNLDNEMGRDIAEEFILDTVMIKKHLDEYDRTTYSFKIYPLNEILDEKEYYNLIYEKVDNQWHELLFKITEKINSTLGETKIEESKLVYTSLPGVEINAICSYTRSVVECDGSCEEEGYAECDGYNCPTGGCYHDETFYFPCRDVEVNYLILDSGPSIGGGGSVSEYEPNPVDENCDGSLQCSSYHGFVLYKQSLNSEYLAFLESHPEINSYIFTYLSQNLFSQASKLFSNQMIAQMILNPELNLDIEASSKSPANIDLSRVQDTTASAVKLRCLYNKLIQSQSFKNLFLNTFGVSDRINVRLEIADDLPANTNGTCQLTTTTTAGITTYLNTIKINRSILEENNSNSKPNIHVIKTILHEFIHAYLNIKKINCNMGTSLPYLNNLELQDLITTFYQDFNCEIDFDGSPQSQHSFMFDFMIPTFQQVFSEIRNDIMPPSHISAAESNIFINSDLNINEPWNWQNFYKYLALAGLHNCQSYQENITSDPSETFLNNVYLIQSNYFSKSCN